MTARILTVDDDEAGRYVTARVLRQAGFDVVEASRGQEALALVESEHPDLVLLDVNLPDVSGHDVCARLRANPDLGGIPILMFSAAFVSGEDRVRGLTGGADAYLAKPVEANELVAVIEALLRMRRAERAVVDLNRALKGKVHELETTIDTLPIGLAISNDPECREIRGNAALASMLGLPPDSNLSPGADGNTYVVRVDGVIQKQEDLPMQRAAAGHVVRDSELEILRRDGTAVFAYGHASPLLDSDGRVCGAVGAFLDISERKAADARQVMLADMTSLFTEALDVDKTLERTAEVAVRHVADWCVIDVIERDGELKRVAAAHRDVAKKDAALKLRSLAADRDRSAPIFQAIESGRPVLMTDIPQHQRELIEKDPDFAAVIDELGFRSLICAPLLARGRSLGVLSAVRASGMAYEEADVAAVADLASRAALALDNAILFQAAEEANRAKDGFFAMVSHELRTPLTSIMGWATMLTKPDIERETMTVGLGEIHRSARAQARIIEDLVDTARISAGKIHLEMASVTLDSVIDESVSLVQQSLTDKRIDVRVTHEPRAVVSGDRQRLVQIASNLLTNAVKFTAEGGRIDVVVAVDLDGATTSFAVRDNGRGITPEFLPHVFDRFAQQENGSGGLGLGLGLNIVQSFVAMHGGQVTVTSDGEGTGSEFVVRLPLATTPAGV